MTRNCPARKNRPCTFKKVGQPRRGMDARGNKYTKDQARCIYCNRGRHTLSISSPNRLT